MTGIRKTARIRKNRKSGFNAGGMRVCKNASIFPTLWRKNIEIYKRNPELFLRSCKTALLKGCRVQESFLRARIGSLRSRAWSSSVLTGPWFKTRPQGRLDFMRTQLLLPARLFEVQAPKQAGRQRQVLSGRLNSKQAQLLMPDRLFEVQAPKQAGGQRQGQSGRLNSNRAEH